ncbi:MAG TPA: glycine betaine ABC transporter substrate-binding protein [Treponemataceae bacterium]|nr:glycine betaine ABC transporter substrate-binding protein [Treponemataceae bacterium]
MKNGKKMLGLILTTMIALTFMIGCSKDTDNTIVIGSKNYNEALVLGNMYASLLEANTDLNIVRKLNLGGTNVAFQALKNGSIDLYPEYTGTGYVSIMGKTAIGDTKKVYDAMKEYYNDELDIAVLTPLGFNNTYAMAVRKDTAEKYNLKTCSDLAKVSDELVLGSTFEFAEREDGYLGMKKVYNMEFKDSKSVDGALRYTALANGNSDVIDAFTTDGLLKMFDLVVLDDDLGFFPPYHGVPIVRNETIKKHPEVKVQLERLGGLVDEKAMIEMNYLVDKEGQDPENVADNFLRTNGLID